MGGYAFYVWGSFGVAAVVWAWNLLVPRLQRKQILKQLTEQE
jgi:heme exporter protein D